MLTSSWLFHIFFWSPVPHSALWSPTDHVESLFQVKSLRLFTRLTSNLSLHLGDHSQFLLPFSFTNWSGLHPSRLSSPPVFLFQAGQSRLRWTGYHAPFQRKLSMNKWPCNEGEIYSTQQSGLQVVLKIQPQTPCELEQNDLLCGYCAQSRLYRFILAPLEETCPEHHLDRTQGVHAPMRSTNR